MFRYGQAKSMLYHYSYESLAPDQANRLMEPFITSLVQTETQEFSTHTGQEFPYVLECQVKVQVGQHTDLLGPGDPVHYDSNEPDCVECAGTAPAKVLAVLHAGSARSRR